MNLVVDRPADLMDKPFQEAMFTMPEFRAHILEADWDSLPFSSKLELRTQRMAGKICFVPLDKVSFSDVCVLRSVYQGISVEGLTLLAYCLQFNYPLYTFDSTLMSVGAQLNLVQFAPVYDQKSKTQTYAYIKDSGWN